MYKAKGKDFHEIAKGVRVLKTAVPLNVMHLYGFANFLLYKCSFQNPDTYGEM